MVRVRPLSVLERGQLQLTAFPPSPMDVARYEVTLEEAEDLIRKQASELLVLKHRAMKLENAIKHYSVLAQLRHLYKIMVQRTIMDTDRAARGLLAPAIVALEEALK